MYKKIKIKDVLMSFCAFQGSASCSRCRTPCLIYVQHIVFMASRFLLSRLRHRHSFSICSLCNLISLLCVPHNHCDWTLPCFTALPHLCRSVQISSDLRCWPRQPAFTAWFPTLIAFHNAFSVVISGLCPLMFIWEKKQLY